MRDPKTTARPMTEQEKAACETATTEAHARFDALLSQTTLREKLVETIAPMLADGRTAGADGVPRVGRATRKKAEQIADAVLARIHGEGLSLARRPGDEQ